MVAKGKNGLRSVNVFFEEKLIFIGVRLNELHYINIPENRLKGPAETSQREQNQKKNRTTTVRPKNQGYQITPS